MAASLPASMAAARIARTAPLPRPAQLAGLGTVLCLYRPQLGAELVGWSRAVRASSQLGVDSDGLRESLWFFDRHDQCCWRLYLLPDSDFVAWDALLSGLPQDPHPPADAGVAERLWRRLARRLGGDSWHARALRLHAAEGELAASVATVSPLGATLARRIARLEAADGEVLVDDCCCARAGQPPPRRDPDHEWPLLRL
ncbi:Hemin transport protein [Xanthomonas sp. AmX2]|uniref:Hemin transport protein n=1 Tax=Xanthomonas sp. TaxID=29446 RepID=UPI0019804D0E|nr:Hemin transport protein [Xanthomonas sp.]MBN6149950.1 Hemin transport protein [Xanthomonas sp.]